MRDNQILTSGATIRFGIGPNLTKKRGHTLANFFFPAGRDQPKKRAANSNCDHCVCLIVIQKETSIAVHHTIFLHFFLRCPLALVFSLASAFWPPAAVPASGVAAFFLVIILR